MKKIVIVMSAIDYGGAQRFCLNFARRLEKLHYDYEVVFLRKSKSMELRNEFKKFNINFIEFNCKSVMRSLPKLIKYFIKNKPNYILCTIDNVDFTTSLAKIFVPKSKLIIRKANVIFDNQINMITRMKLKFESLICYKLVALTMEMKKDYLKYGFKEEKVVVINNMIDKEYIDSRLNEKYSDDIFKTKNKKFIIANARMVEEKRYDILIKSFVELQKKLNNVILLILGEGDLKERVMRMVPTELMDDVIFLGFKNNPYYYMHNSDLLVLSSDYEGFPNVIIEAFACGIPVVSTNCKTGPKEIISNGINGYVVPVHDYKKISNKVYKMLTNDKLLKEMKYNAKMKSDKYDVISISNQYIDLMK